MLALTGLVYGQRGNVTGIVLSEDGAPIPEAEIFLKDSADFILKSDLDGRFEMNLDPGRYTVVLSAAGFEPAEEKVTVRKGEKSHLSLTLPFEMITKTTTEDKEAEVKYSKDRDGSAMHYEVAEEAVGGALGDASYSYDEAYMAAPSMSKSSSTADWMEMPPAPDWVDPDDIITEPKPAVQPKAGQMTAGEWRDIENWDFFSEVIAKEDWKGLPKYWGFDLQKPQRLQVTNSLGTPIPNALIELLDVEGTVLYSATTDNTGSGVVFPALHQQGSSQKIRISQGDAFSIVAVTNEEMKTIPVELEVDVNTQPVIDVAFTVDATGSMGDEMNYLKTELNDVVARVKEDNPGVSVRIGLVFYRDQGDAYVVRSFPFTDDINEALKNINDQYAAGGGDYPEAVHSGLATAIDGLDWSVEARSKLNFLILDAPPHYSNEIKTSLHKSVESAASKGIRIIPVTASGIEKDTEFLMRFMAIATNGTYVFITDHSGIGNSHLEVESTIGAYEVEFLNDLMVRLINEYSAVLSGEDLVIK
jgi:hypothetical protein